MNKFDKGILYAIFAGVVFLVLMVASVSFASVTVMTPADSYEWKNVTISGTAESDTLNTKATTGLYFILGDGLCTAEAHWKFDDQTTMVSRETLAVDGTVLATKAEKCVVILYTASVQTIEAYLQAR